MASEDDLYEARVQKIAKLVLARVARVGGELLKEYPACGLRDRALYEVGGKAALIALLELPDAVKTVLSNRTIAIIAAMVGWSAMFDAIGGGPATAFDDDPDGDRVAVIANLTLERAAHAAAQFLEENPVCGLSDQALHDVGGRAALVAMLELPAAVMAVLSNRTIAIIASMVGWNAMFDAIEDDAVGRYPPGRRLSDG